MRAQVSGGKEVGGGGGEQSRTRSPRLARTGSLEPKQYLPLVPWRALAAWQLCTLPGGFALGILVQKPLKIVFNLFLP